MQSTDVIGIDAVFELVFPVAVIARLLRSLEQFDLARGRDSRIGIEETRDAAKIFLKRRPPPRSCSRR